jgi:hypothetical protein
MKFIASEFAFIFTDREARANLRALLKYLLFLAILVSVYAVGFHIIKLYVEGEQHSWITGIYWTLVVMSTLGFGDITFTSDIGRLFSVVVLLSGVVFLLVMLPFLFIRLFYAPWLEARIRLRAPRHVAPGTRGHVIVTEVDAVALELIERLRHQGTPHVVLEPDPAAAARLASEGISVVAGEQTNRRTYEQLEFGAARLVLANGAQGPSLPLLTANRDTRSSAEAPPSESGAGKSHRTGSPRGCTISRGLAPSPVDRDPDRSHWATPPLRER